MELAEKKSELPVIRLGHLMAFTNFLNHIGAPVERYLRCKKLPVLCDDPDMFAPAVRLWSFFAEAARHEEPALGWLVGSDSGDHSLNIALRRKLETAPSLLLALQKLVQMARSECSHIELGLHERQNDVLFYTHYSGMRDAEGYHISQAYQLGVIIDLIRHFLGQHWVPDEIGVEFPRAPAVVEDQLPGSLVLTNQAVGYVAVPRACLHRAVPCAERKNDIIGDPVRSETWNYINTLRALLKSYLPDGYPSAQFVAELMGVSERTLARKLSAHNLSYGTLVDEVRFAEAKKRLLKPGAQINDVAASVGFDDQSNFNRMFRRVSGLSPREFRKAILN